MNHFHSSITALLNPNGTVAEKYSYDAWGRRRNPVNWNENCQNQNFQGGWIFRIFKDDETV